MSCYHSCGKATSYWAAWSGKHAWCPLPSTDTERNRGEWKRQMLAALWLPVPWKMPCSIYSTCIQFSAAHTLQQQRWGEALDSAQLQLFEKKKEEGVLFLKNKVPSSTTEREHRLEQGHLQGITRHRWFLYPVAPSMGLDQLTPAHSNHYF